MTILNRTWPFGTVKRVVVRRIVPRSGHFVLALDYSTETDKPRYLLLEIDELYCDVEVGQVGTITFIEGGPTGGHWVFEHAEEVN